MSNRQVIGVTVALLALSMSVRAADDAGAGSLLAWARFSDARQQYAEVPYLFLGDGDIRLVFDVPPAEDHVIVMRWGAKGDTREATLTINGQAVKVRHGGYKGFQWVRTAVPKGIQGERYEITLSAGPTSPYAFLAEVRLMATGQVAGVAPNLEAKSHKATVKVAGVARRFTGEAFPEMRPMWDREPAPAVNESAEEKLYRQAEKNARQAAEGLYRCRKFVDGWLAHADPKTGLIPRNLGQSKYLWNGRDSAADNWPFMVLTCALTDRPMFEGRMLEMLRTEMRLTCRVDRLPDDYHFVKQGFAREKIDLDAIIFDGTEYVKDGLLPVTELLGPSPWSERAIGIIDDVWKNAKIDTPFGKLATLNFEVNGDLLQACSRLYWFTGDRKYLDWAIRIGDYYLLGENHPTRTDKNLALSDHACEVINGLSELYVACSFAEPKKREAYRAPLHELYDCVLKYGRDEHGQMWTSMNPKTGQHSKTITDNWGYNYDGLYTVYLMDKREEYRQAVRKALEQIKQHYTGHAWQGGSADGYADSIEGAINLLNREPVASAWEWVDSEIKVMWSKQQPDGVIEGWHGDGNSARTTIMYVLYKTQGVHARPWRPDVRVGAVRDGDGICLSVSADAPWSGKLLFDKPRHKVNMKLPLDYPRINQFPEWFVTQADAKYDVGGKTVSGAELQEGLPVEVKLAGEVRLRVTTVK